MLAEWEFTKQAGKSAMSSIWTKYGNRGKYENEDPEN